MNKYSSTPENPSAIALILGILSIITGIFGVIFFGVFGAVITAVLAVIAIVLGIRANSITYGEKGKSGIITAAVGIVLGVISMAILLSFGSVMASMKHDLPTLAAYSDQTWRGVAGVIGKMASDDVDVDQINAEIDAYNAKLEEVG